MPKDPMKVLEEWWMESAVVGLVVVALSALIQKIPSWTITFAAYDVNVRNLVQANQFTNWGAKILSWLNGQWTVPEAAMLFVGAAVAFLIGRYIYEVIPVSVFGNDKFARYMMVLFWATLVTSVGLLSIGLKVQLITAIAAIAIYAGIVALVRYAVHKFTELSVPEL